MKHFRFVAAFLALPFFIACQTTTKDAQTGLVATQPIDALLTNQKQMTFSGLRAGEGYFSADGKKMIFQSERDADNPFYQIFITDLEGGKTHRISNGVGKTTCSWVHPSGKSVIYSSTHADPKSLEKQKAELDDRAKGVKKMYAWDYDEHYDIYSATIDGKHSKNLTHTLGYDAEGAISPNGKWIVFASNRQAYERRLTAEEQKVFEKNPASFMDLYIMNVDGSQVRQLTKSPGYDGGPFFSPDNNRVVWRRFSDDGTAEIFTINVDGSDEKQLTRLGKMSWAPFYHPSGEYIIFTTNLHGYNNFELYMVDSDGKSLPVRVTNQEGFDGLPVFKPSGQELTWNRKLADGTSQIFIAHWNDELARKALALPSKLQATQASIDATDTKDLENIIKYLASPEMRGRATGSPEELVYTQQLANQFKALGLKPLTGNSFIQDFPFIKEARLGSNNNLTMFSSGQQSVELNTSWLPLAFSKTGEFPVTQTVFAGYGIIAPAEGDQAAYDSYAGLDVKDKWVVIFRYLPENVSPTRKQHLQRYAKLEHKAMIARNLGARGIIVVSGPRSNAKNDLVPFKLISGSGEMSIAAVSISDTIAKDMFKRAGKDLSDTQKDFDSGENKAGFALTNVKFAAVIDIRPVSARGHNVLALLSVPSATHTLIIGAHGDHLGAGHSESSLMRSGDKSDIHFGADDNASGVAAVVRLAAGLSQPEIKKHLRQNILFAVWSGEELGNLGSNYFNAQLTPKSKRRAPTIRLSPSAYINLDMVGRLKTSNSGELSPVAIQGIGSSGRWGEIIETLTTKPLAVTTQQDPYLPTDSMAFYLNQIPAINFFSGVHEDYHSPRDTADKINYQGLAKITQLAQNLSLAIASKNEKLAYKQADRKSLQIRGGFRVSLGTIPDYSGEGIKGVKLSGVVKGGAAEKAGLRAGDIVVEFAKMKIENINDYVFSLQSATPNTPTTIVVMREGERSEVSITPQSKE